MQSGQLLQFDGLSRLFGELRPHFLETQPSSVPDIEAFSLSRFFTKLRGPLQISEQSGLFSDVFAGMRIGKDEIKNAQLLAWFLDWRNQHGMGSRLLNGLLSLAWTPHGLFGSASRSCSVTTEVLPDGLVGSRVDILIEDPRFLVIIEVKIDAGEQPDQVSRYCQIAERRAGSKPWMVVYLTPDGRPPLTGGSWSDHIVNISWNVVAGLLETAAQVGGPSSVAAYLATNFAQHIRTHLGRAAWNRLPTREPQDPSS